jgi:Xaa-Pro aminopeptidase
MVRDGVALTKFFFWIEQNSGSVPMSELSLAEKINHLRSEQENFLGLSFQPIIAFNEHAALPHYSATPDTDSVIGPEGVLLVDSGGQYLDGTTDITRTISIGKPGAKVKKDYTLVLKGHIALALAKFPAGTKGYQLDTLARSALWENGLNYGHGTGHGVGYCLNVHESPPSISPSVTTGTKAAIEPGMLVSNEPGHYREGEYGIRTENLVICYEDEETESGKFLKFETISLCYIDKSLIIKDLLDEKEIRWLNSYHQEVYEKLSPHLNGEEKKWLKEKTEAM